MAKSSGSKGRSGSSAAGSQTVAQAEAAAAPGDQTIAGLSAEDIRRSVDQELHPYLNDADGVLRLLGMGGMDAEQQKKILSAKDADGNPTGGKEILAFLTNPDRLRDLKQRIAQINSAGPQPSTAVPGPSQAAQAAQGGGATQSATTAQAQASASPQPSAAVPGPSPAAQAAQQGASQPGGKKAAKKAKPKEYPKPVGPNVDTTEQFVDAAGARFLKGRIGADQLQKIEMAQSPDGEVKMVYTFKDGSAVVTDQNGNNAVAVPPPGAQAGTTAAAPGAAQQGQAQPQTQQGPPPPPPSILPNDPLVNFGRGVARSIYKAPVAWGAGALTAGGIGSAIAYGLSGRKAPPPPQDDTNDMFQSYQSIFPPEPQPAASGTVPMQPAPATSGTIPAQPMPQANPAGTAPAINTTLLNRIMQSREYA